MENKPEGFQEIEKIAINILRESKSYAVFPTPVERIVQFAELKISEDVDLSTVKGGFISSLVSKFIDAKRKVLGILDFRRKEIYLDSTQNVNKNRFIKLHEVGHNILPWQREIYEHCIDDRHTLSPETNDILESQANYLASSALFQVGIFDEEARKLPLSIKSPMYLASLFGASNHAAFRRYVEHSRKRCALIVFEQVLEKGSKIIKIRDYFQSASFTNYFGSLSWSPQIDSNFPFMLDVYQKRRYKIDGTFACTIKDIGITKFNYHFFNNTYNMFVLLFPIGEMIKSKTKIYVPSEISSMHRPV